MKKIFSKSQSFTLVEMLVAAAIFVILITLGMSSFSTMVKARKHADTSTNLQEAGRVIMERIAKEAENINMLISQDAMVTATTGYVDHGFIILQEGFEVGSGTNGQTIEGPILKIYKPEDKWIAFHLSNNSATCSTDCRLQMKDKSGEFDLSPATVNVTSLSFKGYHPGTGIQPFSTTPMVNRQAPYVTINLTLRDETTGQVASFKTTVSPEIRTSFLPHVQIQSGFQANPKEKKPDNFELGYHFNPQFDSPPAVIISKNYGFLYGGGDGELTPKIYNVDNYSFSRNIPGCSGLMSCGNNSYGVNWIAVQGHIKGVLESGFTPNNGDYERKISFQNSFERPPIVVFAVNWWGFREQIPKIDDITVGNFTIKGDVMVDKTNGICGTTDDDQCGIYWVAVDGEKLKDFPKIGGKPFVQAGKIRNGEAGVCLRCAEPEECTTPDPNGRCQTGINCHVFGLEWICDKYVDSCSAEAGCTMIVGQATFPFSFSESPVVAAARSWFDGTMNMFKIDNIESNGFQYEGSVPYNSGAIYWIAAANGNYSSKWRYE